MKIVVIDYGLGNLASVYNALKILGSEPKISDSPDDVKKAVKIILPGVGAFRDCLNGLKKRNLIDALKSALASGKVYLGICLGLQILFEASEEGNIKGLGVLKGKVKRFREEDKIKVPQIGWNKVDYRLKTEGCRLLDGIEDNSHFYFDHSYYVDPSDKDIVAATTDYGKDFTSMIRKDNIYGVQFHPERSQKMGLKMLENFIAL